MRINILLPASILALMAAPVFAQDAPPPADDVPPAAPSTTLTAEQQASFDAWPAEVQSYYTGLTPDRQVLFWRLSDANKVTLAGLPAESQAQAWAQIEAQANGPAAPPAPATPPSDGLPPPSTPDPAAEPIPATPEPMQDETTSTDPE